VLAQPESAQAKIFEQVASTLAGQVSQVNFQTAEAPEMPAGPRVARP
jgi:hypothetical protein